MCSERTWTTLSEYRMCLNTPWVQVNTFEWALKAVEHAWMHVNTFEWVWTQLNALIYWFLHKNQCTWMSLMSVNAIEHIWMHSECMWPPLSKYWMHLNALWVFMNAFEWVLNATECAWTCLSVHDATEWVLNLKQCAPLVEVIYNKINRTVSNWMGEWNDQSF